MPTICEICGSVENNEQEAVLSNEHERLLHVCPDCLKDRQVSETASKA